AQHEVVFVAVRRDEEAALPVDGQGGYEHHGRAERRAERRDEADGQQQAAENFGPARGERIAATRLEAEAFQILTRAVRAVPAEPAEYLLCTVSGQCQADGQPQQENPDFHDVLLFSPRLCIYELRAKKNQRLRSLASRPASAFD